MEKSRRKEDVSVSRKRGTEKVGSPDDDDLLSREVEEILMSLDFSGEPQSCRGVL